MRDHSISLFHLEGAPVLEHRETTAGTRVTFGEIGSIHGVDFYIPPEHAERVKRAVEAFTAVMNEVEHVRAAE